MRHTYSCTSAACGDTVLLIINLANIISAYLKLKQYYIQVAQFLILYGNAMPIITMVKNGKFNSDNVLVSSHH